MKKLMMIPLVAVGMITMSGCSQSPVKETAKNDAINLANLDTTVAPGTDFYQYACGGWIKNNPLKPEYSRFGTCLLYTSKSANKWIDDALIVEAKILLKAPQATVQQVADMLHFSDQSTFGKFFKKHMGISPMEYRKS